MLGDFSEPRVNYKLTLQATRGQLGGVLCSSHLTHFLLILQRFALFFDSRTHTRMAQGSMSFSKTKVASESRLYNNPVVIAGQSEVFSSITPPVFQFFKRYRIPKCPFIGPYPMCSSRPYEVMPQTLKMLGIQEQKKKVNTKNTHTMGTRHAASTDRKKT